jgi:hypothetical protein
MSSAEQRAQIAQSLKQEAALLLHRSGLFRLLEERFGKLRIAGSAGYDLMVRRDIDIHVPVELSAWAEWAYLLAEIARQLQDAGLDLCRATYHNSSIDPHPMGAGLCWRLVFHDAEENPWSCTLWGWDPFDYAIREARDESLSLDLARADRDLILRLKTEAQARQDESGQAPGSFDIYQFCIAGAGDSLDELSAWKAAQSAT